MSLSSSILNCTVCFRLLLTSPNCSDSSQSLVTLQGLVDCSPVLSLHWSKVCTFQKWFGRKKLACPLTPIELYAYRQVKKHFCCHFDHIIHRIYQHDRRLGANKFTPLTPGVFFDGHLLQKSVFLIILLHLLLFFLLPFSSSSSSSFSSSSTTYSSSFLIILLLLVLPYSFSLSSSHPFVPLQRQPKAQTLRRS